MKKLFLLLMMGGAILAGCSNQENLVENESQGGSNTEATYLSINLVAAGNAGTRANDYWTDNDFSTGDEDERFVGDIYFFFFDEDGNATPVGKKILEANNEKNISYYRKPYTGIPENDKDLEGVDGDKSETVSGVIDASIIPITTPDGVAKPSQVLVVLNPSSEVLNLLKKTRDVTGNIAYSVEGPSLSELKISIEDFKTGLTNPDKESGLGGFVMSNSVYNDTEDEKTVTVYTVKITEDDFHETVAEAKDKPVKIWVERVLARLNMTIGLEPMQENGKVKVFGENGSEQYNIYQTFKSKSASATQTKFDVIGDDGEEKEEDIYVRFLGWNITCATNKSRLIKEISTDWTNNLFENEPWNAAIYHRSFWAINPTGLEYQYGNFNGNETPEELNQTSYYPAMGNTIPLITADNEKNGGITHVYLQENAAKTATETSVEYPTQVIFAAQLVDKDGKPLKLAEWLGELYTIDGLKKAIADNLNDLYYKKTTTSGEGTDGATTTIYVKITPECLTFTPESKDNNKDVSGRYYVDMIIADTYKGYEWYEKIGTEDKEEDFVRIDDVNAYIDDYVTHVKVWGKDTDKPEEQGLTYYFFNIRHLNDDTNGPGYYGVVRNHIYDTMVTALTGLGTPVYDPDRVIYPEKPEKEEGVFAAEVRILQWRVVQQSHDLDW